MHNLSQCVNYLFCKFFFWGGECVVHFFANLAHFISFERCLDSNPEGCRSKQARNQLCHPSPLLSGPSPSLSQPSPNLATHLNYQKQCFVWTMLSAAKGQRWFWRRTDGNFYSEEIKRIGLNFQTKWRAKVQGFLVKFRIMECWSGLYERLTFFTPGYDKISQWRISK